MNTIKQEVTPLSLLVNHTIVSGQVISILVPDGMDAEDAYDQIMFALGGKQ